MNKVPTLNPGQVTLLRCDVNTGNVLKTNGELYLQTGEIYQTFDTFDAAEQFISTALADNSHIEFVIYGYEGEPILSWSKFEKKRLS
jgi:hypothetical protein